MVLFGLKGTGLPAQEWSPPVQLFGLWNDVFPFELKIDSSGNGTLHYESDPFPITLVARPDRPDPEWAEVLPDGSLGGIWTFPDREAGKRAEWSNYNQTLGASSRVDTRPLPAPDVQIKLFQFRCSDGDWYFFVYPAPPAKWRGIAWSNTYPTPLEVTGGQEGDQFFWDIYHEAGAQTFRLSFSATRTYPRFGWWSGTKPVPEKIRFRHRKSVRIGLRGQADFTGEMLVFEPQLDWPAWKWVDRNHLDPVVAQYAREKAAIGKFPDNRRPYYRHSVRMYAWVTWSFLRDDLLSGALHVASSWESPARYPFLISRQHAKPLTLQDIWAPWPVPRNIAALAMHPPFADQPATVHPVLELRPDGLYLWQDQPVHIPTQQIRGTLPKESVLYPYFGK